MSMTSSFRQIKNESAQGFKRLCSMALAYRCSMKRDLLCNCGMSFPTFIEESTFDHFDECSIRSVNAHMIQMTDQNTENLHEVAHHFFRFAEIVPGGFRLGLRDMVAQGDFQWI